jgi:hypothetical protein
VPEVVTVAVTALPDLPDDVPVTVTVAVTAFPVCLVMLAVPLTVAVNVCGYVVGAAPPAGMYSARYRVIGTTSAAYRLRSFHGYARAVPAGCVNVTRHEMSAGTGGEYLMSSDCAPQYATLYASCSAPPVSTFVKIRSSRTSPIAIADASTTSTYVLLVVSVARVTSFDRLAVLPAYVPEPTDPVNPTVVPDGTVMFWKYPTMFRTGSAANGMRATLTLSPAVRLCVAVVATIGVAVVAAVIVRIGRPASVAALVPEATLVGMGHPQQ